MGSSAKPASAWLLLLALLPAGCTAARLDLAADIARRGGLSGGYVAAGAFTMLVYQRLQKPGSPLHVYIEGDGQAWVTPTQISKDPTPSDPIALRLAAADRSDNVAYVARPCQYASGPAAQGCVPAFWSSDRYGPAVIDGMAAAIDGIEAQAASVSLVLFGYSGGGTVAALIAARRTDVSRLVTIAANLDVAAWTRLHRATPLTGSLEPLAYREQLKLLPQTHFVGGRDEIVPADIVRSYAEALGEAAPVTVIGMPDFTHECCWPASWPALLATLDARTAKVP